MVNGNGKKINSSGYSLIELIIALALAVGVLSLGGSLFSFMSKVNVQAQNSVDLEMNARSLEYILPLYLEHAINVDWTASPILNIGSGKGLLRNYQSQVIGGAPVAVGVFLREAGIPSQSIPMSDLRGTGIYFVNPTPTTEGRLIISSSASGTGNVAVSSDKPTHSFGSIVDFEISSGGLFVSTGSPVRVAKIKIIYRKFLTNNKDQWRWCPQAEMTSATCQTEARYIDREEVLHIPFINNAFPTQLSSSVGVQRKETLFGQLYFFNYTQRSQ